MAVQTIVSSRTIIQVENVNYKDVPWLIALFEGSGWDVVVEPAQPECCRKCPGRFGGICHCTLPHHYGYGVRCDG
jgi:hypothetical protein